MKQFNEINDYIFKQTILDKIKPSLTKIYIMLSKPHNENDIYEYSNYYKLEREHFLKWYDNFMDNNFQNKLLDIPLLSILSSKLDNKFFSIYLGSDNKFLYCYSIPSLSNKKSNVVKTLKWICKNNYNISYKNRNLNIIMKDSYYNEYYSYYNLGYNKQILKKLFLKET